MIFYDNRNLQVAPTESPAAHRTGHTDDELLKFIENNLDIEEKDINSLIRAEVKHYANFGYSGKW